MSKAEKHKERLELLKKYFREESPETIKNDWNKLNDYEFGGVTIGDFLDYHNDSNLQGSFHISTSTSISISISDKSEDLDIDFCCFTSSNCLTNHDEAYLNNFYFSYSQFLQSGIEQIVEDTLDKEFTTNDHDENNKNEAGNTQYAMAA